MKILFVDYRSLNYMPSGIQICILFWGFFFQLGSSLIKQWIVYVGCQERELASILWRLWMFVFPVKTLGKIAMLIQIYESYFEHIK